MNIDGIWVRDSFDLLDGLLLEPEEGETYPRQYREVFISGGFLEQRYGGPEEGGWWYDAFDPQIEITMYPRNEEELIRALHNVASLVKLRTPWDDVRKEIIIRPDEYHQQSRPYYE